MVNILQSPNRGWGNYSSSLKYTEGESEWTIDYNSNPMWNMNCHRDNIEHLDLDNGIEILRMEEGIKAPNRMVTHCASLQYSYMRGTKLFLNTQGRIKRQDDRYYSKGNISTISGNDISIDLEEEISPTDLWQYDIDLYAQYNINRRNKIFVNIVPTLLDGNSHRIYKTTELDINTSISTKGYRLLGEAFWEGAIGRGTVSCGLRDFRKWTSANYYQNSASIEENDATSSIFAEWKQSINRLHYNIGIEGTYSKIIKPINKSFTFLSPRLFLRYTPSHWGGISLSINSRIHTPAINDFNTTPQRIDRYQYSIGNTHLHPYRQSNICIELDGQLKDIYAKLSVADSYSHRPVMETSYRSNGNIINSVTNSGLNNDLVIKALIRSKLFIRELSLSSTAGWHRTTSRGLNYKHTYSQPFVNLQLMFLKNGWWAMLKYNNSYNILWGEKITSVNNNMLNIGVGYTYRHMTFTTGIVNPIGNICIKSESLSPIARYDRNYQASSSKRLVWIGITFTFHHGKRRSSLQKRIDNKTSYEQIKPIRK